MMRMNVTGPPNLHYSDLSVLVTGDQKHHISYRYAKDMADVLISVYKVAIEAAVYVISGFFMEMKACK